MSTVEPVDKRQTLFSFPNTLPITVPVLDKRFADEINFLQYNTFPVNEQLNSAIVKEWAEEVKIICHDLKKLLMLSHENFWAQVIHDKSIHCLLSAYVQKAPRVWDVWAIPEPHKVMHDNLNQLVFYALLRMSTDKESDSDYLSAHGFGYTIYENYMFDIPKIMDIASLYGDPYGGNGPLVNKMLTNIFTKQDGYVDDFKSVSQYIFNEAFPKIMSSFREIQTINGLYDLLYYYFDMVTSLLCFFSTYPPILNFTDTHLILSELFSLFQTLFGDIKTKIKKLSDPATDFRPLKVLVQRAEVTTVRLMHCVMWNSSLMDKLSNTDLSCDEHTEIAHNFINLISLILHDNKLMHLYYNCCNLPKTFAIIKNSKAEIGQDHFNYILNAIQIEKSFDEQIEKCHDNTETSKKESELSLLIENIKTILPQYPDDFISKCLNTYGNDEKATLEALLENNLPPHLLNEVNLPGNSNDGVINANKSGSLLSSRHNVFDNDDFDIFNNPDKVDFSKIRLGKQTSKANQDTRDTKDYLYKNQKYTYAFDEYDDEYDDTYDGLTGPVEALSISDSENSDVFLVRPLNEHNLHVEPEEEKTEVANPPIHTDSDRGKSFRGKGKQPQKREKPDDKTLYQRNRNERNKAHRANHNRRAGADRKRRGGMISI